MNIYMPAEDSYLLSETLENYLINLINNNNNSSSKNQYKSSSFKTHSSLSSNKIINNGSNRNKKIKILDMGSGSGIQAKTCRKLGFKDVLTADVNPNAVRNLKKQGFRAIKTNLFLKLYKRKGDLSGKTLVPIRFDLIIFNPPYLPEDKLEPKDSKLATTAGKKGYELIIKFLKQAKSHLNKKGAIMLLFSSLSQPSVIKNKAKQLGYNLKLLKKQKLFFEELYVYELSDLHRNVNIIN
jgi:HemK-related putative methylase